MVKYNPQLDAVFGSLSHPIRRDILQRGARKELSVSEIAKPYNLTLAAISKHLRVLEEAKLITKRRQGKQYFVRLAPIALADATAHLKHYEKLWNERLDALENYLKTL